MTAKELRKLRRRDLLEILLTLRKENEQLRRQLAEAQRKLEDRKLEIDDSASLAEAALRLNGVFEAAEAACEMYRENIRLRCEELEKETRWRREAMLEIVESQEHSDFWLDQIMDETE